MMVSTLEPFPKTVNSDAKRRTDALDVLLPVLGNHREDIDLEIDVRLGQGLDHDACRARVDVAEAPRQDRIDLLPIRWHRSRRW